MRWHTTVLATAALILAPASAAWSCGAVEVVKLSVDGRFDAPLDLGNPRPTVAWQIIQSRDCDDPVCPGDQQTAYRVQAATTIGKLRAGQLDWDTQKTNGSSQQVLFGRVLGSRDSVAWRVRVWDALGNPSRWSEPSNWATGLLEQSDWGDARWIDYPDRRDNQPLPLFVRQFDIPEGKDVADAKLYVSGVGLHHVTANGKEITDEVLAPGYSNLQLSNEYSTYDVKAALHSGANAIGVSLGNGPSYLRRSITNPAVGRNAPYSWWESQLQGNSTLAADVQSGSTTVSLSSTTAYHVGGTINIDIGNGGDNLECRAISTISNNVITFTPGLELAHKAGVKVTGSGNNIAASDPAAGAAVAPRLIGRLEITYSDGSSSAIVTDRSWRTTLGPLVTNQWFSGSDYDARREQAGWDRPGADLYSAQWLAAGFAPPPNLATKLVARAAEPVKIQERFTPVSVTNPIPDTWLFDFGQNFAGFPLLNLPELPAGVTIRVSPAEGLSVNGTIDQTSIGAGPGGRGQDIFNTYTTAGRAGGESWCPSFNYFGMQWVQITGLPAGFQPGPDLVTGLRVHADVPLASTFTSSDARVNRIHKMAWYSFASNMVSVFTDCPGREKNGYPADFTMSMGASFRNYHIHAYLRNIMRNLGEGQSVADTPMNGNVPLKIPVFDVGYGGRFGDEINWGDGIVLVPSLLHDLYGDTSIMASYYDQMTAFVNYIQREKVQGYIVDAALADWVEDNGQTSGRITGTWGYYLTIKSMARMANLTGHTADAEHYTSLASEIRDAFNRAFYNDASGRYTNTGNNSTSKATQSAQALALDAGLVPHEHRQQVLDALVELAHNYPSSQGQGPHLSGGTIGLGSIVRALSAGGRDDVLWEALQQNDRPSYGYFMQPTITNPNGYTTIAESWDRSSSKNHMILAQIEEWFHAGVAGIQPNSYSTFSSLYEDRLVFQPKPVGDLSSATGSYQTQFGEARSEWVKTTSGAFTLTVTVPCNINAEVRVFDPDAVKASGRAKRTGVENGYAIYTVPSGTHVFNTTYTP